MDQLIKTEEFLGGKRKKAPATPAMPAKLAKVDNKKSGKKKSAKKNKQQKPDQLDIAEEIDDDPAFIFKFTRMRLRNEAIKLIEKDRREDITKLYDDEKKEWNCKQQDVLKEDMDVFKEYDFTIALHLADTSREKKKFGYEYYYVKAARMDPSFNSSHISDAVNRKKEKLEKMTIKIGHYKQYSKQPNNQIEQINKSRFYALVQNTVAIEGNKFELDEVERFLNAGETFSKRTPHDHNEVTDAAFAIKFADKQIIPNDNHITLETILDLHEKVMKTTKPECGGELRKVQVFVGEYMPPKHHDIPELMSKFIKYMNTDTKHLHPIEAAAQVHQEFVTIHPFVDGNGRIGRLLMNIVLQRNGYPAIVIPMDQRKHYYDSLEKCHDGYYEAFIELIAMCVEKALNEYMKL